MILTTDGTNLKELSDVALTENFSREAKRESEAIADVVCHVHEFMVRRLYLNHQCTSLFEYMTSKLGYARATAQKRIDAARLLDIAPGLSNDLASGAIGLTQISILSQGLRQFEKERGGLDSQEALGEEVEHHARELLSKMKNQDVKTSSVLIAKELNLELQELERTRHQRDESVRLEVTLSKTQMEDLRRVKDLTSHVNHNANWADVISYLTKEFLKRKDLTIEKPARVRKVQEESAQVSETAPEEEFSSDRNFKRTAIPMAIRRDVARGGWKCQHVDFETGEICESTYQVQFDHIRSVSAGGGNERENLQLLCAQHNRLKYQRGG